MSGSIQYNGDGTVTSTDSQGNRSTKSVSDTADPRAEALAIPRRAPRSLVQDAGPGGTIVYNDEKSSLRMADTSGMSHQAGADKGESYASDGTIPSVRVPNSSMERPASDARPDDRLILGGSETSVKGAIAAGLVHQDGNGNLKLSPKGSQLLLGRGSETGKKPEPKAADPEAQDVEPTGDDAVEQMITVFADNTDRSAQIAGIESYLRTGEVSTNVVHTAAQQLGIAPDVVADRLGGIEAALRSQVETTVMREYGLDWNDVAEWAAQERQGALNDAIRNHVKARTLSGYRDLVRQYRNSLKR